MKPLSLLDGEYSSPKNVLMKLIDEDMRQQVEACHDTNRFERFESESLTGKDMSYCKCGTKDEVGGFTCGQHCSRIEKNGLTNL